MTDPGRAVELTFDYTQLDGDTRTTLQDHATRLRALAQDAALGLWQMGEILADAQERLAFYGRGTFQRWVEAEADVGLRTAYRLIDVYRRFDCDNLAQTTFAASALYVLAELSTPPQARAEALYRAQRGEAITHAKAQEMVQTYKPLPEPPPRPPPMVRTPEYDTFERDVLRPQLHDAGKPDAPQMLTGRHGPLVPVPEERKEQARVSLREAIVERFVSVRRAVADRIHCLLGECDGLAILNDERYLAMWTRLVAEYDDMDECDQVEVGIGADELLEMFGRSVNSIAIAARWGAALKDGPLTLNDLVEIALEVCGVSMDGLDREEYLSWRKKSLRLLDGICYVNGLPVFEHVLDGGQLVYGLLGSGNYSQIKEEYDGQVPKDSNRVLA